MNIEENCIKNTYSKTLIKILLGILLIGIINSCKKEQYCIETPIFINDTPTNLTDSTCTLSCNIEVPSCNYIFKSKGYLYGTDNSFQKSDTIYIKEDNTLVYTLKNLKPNKKYYYKLFFKTLNNNYEGDTLSFKTKIGNVKSNVNKVSNITDTSFTITANIASICIEDVIEKGICWSKKDSPTINDNTEISKDDNLSYSKKISGLPQNTHLFVKSYVIAKFGTFYSETTTIKTQIGEAKIDVPELLIIEEEAITIKSFISSTGSGTILKRGFLWSEFENPTIKNNHIQVNNDSTIFTSKITNLKPNTKYFIRSYVVNEVGIFYSEQIIVKTPIHTPVVYLVGDSTCSDYNNSLFPRAGWGSTISKYFDLTKIKISNRAKPGYSSKSYYETNNCWNSVLNDIRPNDYVIIQFGHNDQKSFDKKRYTEANTTYIDFLKKYINETKLKNASPILITSINRNSWNVLSIQNSLGDYPNAMRKLSILENIPLIDAHKITKNVFEKYGKEYTTKQIFMNLEPNKYPNYPEGNVDNTHLQDNGAKIIGKEIIIDLLDKSKHYKYLIFFKEVISL